MKKNIFLRSTLRQPVKTAMLLLVTVLITFAFVARVSEYLLIKQETERLGDTYTAVGVLNGRWQDTSEAAAYLEAREDVDVVNTYRYVPAVMEEGFCNADTDLNNLSSLARNCIFYGTLHTWNGNEFFFTVDEVLTGYPEYYYFMGHEGRQLRLRPYVSAWSSWADVEDLDSAYAGLEHGGRYLVFGYFDPLSGHKIVDEGQGDDAVHYTSMGFYPLLDDGFFLPVQKGQEPDWSTPGIRDWLPDRLLGIQLPLAELERTVSLYTARRMAQLGIQLPSIEDFLPEGSATSQVSLPQFIELVAEEQRALNVIAAADMSVLPEIKDEEAPDIYLVDGRWLDKEDDAQERKVCVINAAMATMRGLSVGDTLDLTLRDIPYSYMGYYFPPYEMDWDTNPDGSFNTTLGDPDPSWEIFLDPQVSTDTYEIVGIYDYVDIHQNSSFRNNAYIPASAVPEGFVNIGVESLDESCFFTDLLPQPDRVSFALTSPDAVTAFTAETRADLLALGYEPEFLENGWETFQAASVPMRRSALVNAAIFTGVLLAALCLVTLAYFRMRRKDIAIARALGVPAGRCTLEASIPLLLAGLLGAGVGSWLGWRYTLDHADETLAPLSGLGEEFSAALPLYWLVLLGGGVLVLLALITSGSALFLSSRPVLALVQGGTLAAQKKVRDESTQASVQQPAAPVVFTGLAVREAAGVPAASPGLGCAHVLRFVWRHIARSKLKTALSVLLAAGFTIGLAAIRLSIVSSQEKIDWLYENTSVEAELVQADTTQSLRGTGFLRQDTLDVLLASEYVTDAYVEGSCVGAVFPYTPGMEVHTPAYISDVTQMIFRAFEDESVFLSPAGSGTAVTITYFDGWDGSLFAQEWPEERFPVVLPKEIYDEFGDIIGLSYNKLRVCDVAGYYEGHIATSYGDTEPVLIPIQAYREASSGRTAYSKAHVTLAPSLNRELDRFTEFLNELSATQGVGIVGLRATFWDEELRLAVAPLENSVELMQVLYPVTLVLSLLVAAGIAVLFVMTSAKEAAIMRVLGTSKLKSRLMLALQTVFTSAAGLVVGVLGILAYTGRTRPDLFANLLGASALCAMLYLLAAIIGAAASASAVTGRNPLELLQVKE